jgi:hypothetical protein
MNTEGHEGKIWLGSSVTTGAFLWWWKDDVWWGAFGALTPTLLLVLIGLVYGLSEVAVRLAYDTHKNADGSINWRDQNRR